MSPRILVTEDDRVQREVIADILNQAGYETLCSASGGETLEILSGSACDVLLTDLKMPGMDGLELMREAGRIPPELDVVIMTAHA